MATFYSAYVDGFSATLLTFEEFQAWWDALKAKNNFAGKDLKVWKGQNCKINNGERTAVFSSVPFKTFSC